MKGEEQGNIYQSVTMKPKILSWNVRGCGGSQKRMLIKSCLRKWSPDLVCLQETKLGAIDNVTIRSLWGGSWIKWTTLDAVGASGGILLMWDSRKLLMLESEIGIHSVSGLFKHLNEEISWSFTGVYGPIDRAMKIDFLEEIGAAVFRWQVPWCMGGDFNMVKGIEDKWRCVRRTNQMQLFSDFINDLGCIDLPLNGCQFTWRNSISKSRLDRFLVSCDWEDWFPEIIQKAMPRVCSDHCPLMLDSGGLKSGPKPFRFENMWLQVDGFSEMISNWWQSYIFEGSASFVLSEKLKCLKTDLKRWNSEVFGRLDLQKKQLEFELQRFDLLDESRSLTLKIYNFFPNTL